MEKRKYSKRGKLIHGFMSVQHPLWATYNGIKQRCYNKNYPGYINWGGRGIKMCDKWLLSFENFAIDVGLKPFKDASLDRINNSGDYEPDNVRWTTRTEQCLNRRLFKNNKCKNTGIIKKGNVYNVHYSNNKIKYRLGSFSTLDDAVNFRNRFIKIFVIDKEQALKIIEKKPNINSVTKITGITLRSDGWYAIKVKQASSNLKDKRLYIGIAKTLQDAIKIQEAWYEQNRN